MVPQCKSYQEAQKWKDIESRKMEEIQKENERWMDTRVEISGFGKHRPRIRHIIQSITLNVCSYLPKESINLLRKCNKHLLVSKILNPALLEACSFLLIDYS